MSEFKTHIEIEVTVSGDYQPEESQTHNYPGCAECATLGAVLVKTTNFHNEEVEVDILDYLPHELVASLEEELILEEYQKAERQQHMRGVIGSLNRSFRDAMAHAFRRHNMSLVKKGEPQ